MKKLLLSILSILLLFGTSFAYEVRVHYNGNTEIYNVDSDTSITLTGDWSRNGDSFTFNSNYSYTDIYYVDGYGNTKTNRVATDQYFNGNWSVGYTGNQYTMLTDDTCGVFTGYLPSFNVSGNITEIDTGNVFGNFFENGLTVLLSNIPNYIQYVIILLILLVVYGFIRKLR